MISTQGTPKEWIKGAQNDFSEGNISGLITVERFLASRGFEVKKVGNGKDTIIPRSAWTFDEASKVFRVFDNLNTRQELLNHILGGRHATSEYVKNILSITEFKGQQKAFAHTFEWYVSELIKWKFRAFDSAYGVEIKDIKNFNNQEIGDYDVLAVLGNLDLLYIECKTGGFCGDHVRKAIERSRAIHCVASIIFLGKPYDSNEIRKRLEKIQNRDKFGLQDQEKFHKISATTIDNSEIYKWNDCYFISAETATVNVEAKIRTTLRLISSCNPNNQRVFSPDLEELEELGFKCETNNI